MSSDLPRKYVVPAFVLVMLAAVVLGMVLQSNFKSAPTVVANAATYADVTLVVQGDWLMGPGNKTHDAFVPCNFTVYADQIVNLTIVNFDVMSHSFTSTSLNVNFQAPGSQTDGVAAVSNFQFSAAAAGVYRWWCSLPCDTDAGGWAMTTGSDGQPGQIGFMGGFVTVLQG